MISEPAAIICGILILVFVTSCGILTIAVAVAGGKPRPVPPMLIIDPETPGQAINEAGELVTLGGEQ